MKRNRLPFIVSMLAVTSMAGALCLEAGAESPARDAGRQAPPATAPSTPPGGPSVVTVVYDITDLVNPIPNFPATPPVLPGKQPASLAATGATVTLFGIGNVASDKSGGTQAAPAGPMGLGGAAARPDAAASDSGGSRIDEIMKIIMETTSRDTWKDMGGEVGEIHYIDHLLVVSQTPKCQSEIATLLAHVQAQRTKMVRLRARWLLLSPDQLDKLVPPQAAGGSGNKAVGGDSGSETGAASVLPEVDLALLAKLGQVVEFRAQTTCFNGQTVSVTSGRQRSVVSSVSAVVGTDAGGYDPTIGILNSGLTLQVTPSLSAENHAVNLTVESTYTGAPDTGAGATAAAGQLLATSRPGVPAEAVGLIDRINAVSQSLRTSVRVPLNKAVLIGGMTLEPNADNKDAPQLYLVVEASASM